MSSENRQSNEISGIAEARLGGADNNNGIQTISSLIQENERCKTERNSTDESPSTSTSLNIAESSKEESDCDDTTAPVSNHRTSENDNNLTETSTITSPHRVVMLPRVNTDNIVAISENSNVETPNGEGGNSSLPSNNFFSSLTPAPSALVSTSFPAITVFKSGFATKLSGGQIVCGILELVCGFGISEGVDGSFLPFYLRSAMPIWTGAIYLMTAVTGSVAINSKRQLTIIVFAVFSLISLGLSIALSALIAPDVTGYATEACYNNSSSVTPSDTETEALQCNEAKLVTVLAGISLTFGLIDAVISFISVIICGQALFRCCSKPDVNVVQEAPVFFRTGPTGDVEANIITGRHRPPVVVPLPEYNDVVSGSAVLPPTTNQVPSQIDPMDVGELPFPPRTPPPAYRRSISTENNSTDDDVST